MEALRPSAQPSTVKFKASRPQSYTSRVHRFGMMLKSYEADFPLAQRMVESFNTFNSDLLPMTIVVPTQDLDLFASLANNQISVIDESVFAAHLATEPFGDMRLGYINQQIVKLAFWERDIYDDYFTVDSDLVFIRPFTREDFMFDEDTPYTILVEDNDLHVDARYRAEHWDSRSVHLQRIKEHVGLDDRRSLTCHGHQVLSSIALRSLRDDFMSPRGYTYKDLLVLSPYEFSWYNFWLQKSQVIPIMFREPVVKVLHHDGQHLEFAVRGTRLDDVAHAYLAIVVNSNFTRIWPDISPDEPTSATLSRYVPASVLVSALARKSALIPRLLGVRRNSSTLDTE